MKKIDYHIHTDFSIDSSIKLSELIPHAIRLGYSELVITEHLDFLPQEQTKLGIPSLKDYRNHITKMQKYFQEIRLYFGIEVGDYQSVKDIAEPIIKQNNFELILGSVHFIKNRINVAIPIKEKLTKSDILDYYEQNLLLAETCEINVLAHLGVYKRYFKSAPDETHCLPVIHRIFEVMIDNGIALEINYSCMRKNYKHLIPENHYLLIYKNLGGNLVTIGSDSHTIGHFDDNYELALRAVQHFNFQQLEISI